MLFYPTELREPKDRDIGDGHSQYFGEFLLVFPAWSDFIRRSSGNDATRANASPYTALTNLWLSATTSELSSVVHRD